MATAGGWLKGCAIGCGATILISIVLVVGCGLQVMAPFKSAEKARDTLEEQYGVQGEYRPASDGSVAPERMEVFLAVRDDLLEHCEAFEETFAQFEHMDELADDEDTTKMEMFRGVMGTMGNVMGFAGRMGGFARARNEALLEHGMGLGEYTYIYVLGYLSWLDMAGEGQPDDEIASRRVRGALRDMLRHQLDALRNDAPDDPFIETLTDEILTLESDHDRLPWADGLPPAVEASFAPYRDDVRRTWCLGTSPFELTVFRSKSGGFAIEGD